MNAETKLTDTHIAVLRCLDHAIRRDAEKGGEGMRSTPEVAERVGVSTSFARSCLYSMTGSPALVDCYDDRPLAWRITPAGLDALSKAGG